MTDSRTSIRLGIPSKGRLSEKALKLLADAGMTVYKQNPRQYEASIPSLPNVTVLFQRPGDIAVGIKSGSLDFGISGWDIIKEKAEGDANIVPLLPHLGFGYCSLNMIVPETWTETRTMADLRQWQVDNDKPLRVATKFPYLTRQFLNAHGLASADLIEAEGTLEIAPTIGYADVIVDLVSSGMTLRDNRLRTVDDGLIVESEAALVGNADRMRNSPQVLDAARHIIEFIVANLRARDNMTVTANVRGKTADIIAQQMFAKSVIGGLQGPTISPIYTRDGEPWHAINIIVHQNELATAIKELRSIGGSGVIVRPVSYIFEEEPEEWKTLIEELGVGS